MILYPTQQRIVDLAKPNFLYACDTGTGKSLMALHHYLKHNKGEPLLIVAPPSKAKEGGWNREVKFVEETYKISFAYAVEKYSILSKKWTDYKGYFVVFDECHYIKNSTSQRGKAAFLLAKNSTHFILLSATPTPNGYEDFINYFKMFNFTKNKSQFNSTYGIWGEGYAQGGRSFKKIIDYKHTKELDKLYQSISVTIKKEEMLDLKPITFKKVFFKPSKEYKTILNDNMLDDEVFDTMPKLLSGLRQYANTKDKIEYIKEFLEGTTRNVVIFYNFKHEVKALKEIIQKELYFVSGEGMKIPPKNEWKDITNSVTLVQYQAGSAGIELQYASEVIYYSPTYSYSDYQQSLGRCYRNGQDKKVTVYQFETKGTIESAVWKALANKQNFDEKMYQLTKLGGK